MSIVKTLKALAAGALGALAVLNAAQAANFTVEPIRVELSPRQPSFALTIRNQSEDDAVVVQLQTMAWSQDQGQEILAPSHEVLATPPIFTLAPGAAQVVRVAYRRPMPQSEEQSYRLLVREVPAAPDPNKPGVQLELEMSLPVFIKPAAPVQPDLRWQASLQPDGGISLAVRNEGNAHVQLANLAFSLPDGGDVLAGYAGFGYVLPRQTREFPLKPLPGKAIPPGASLRLKAYADTTTVDLPLAID
ncbi:MAG: hypothetical protein RJA36_1348 [Pseudomonadota bacterium]|jgi:fimbrial chaperone protein